MKVSLKLLNDYVKIEDIDPQYLADQLSLSGFEVEGIEPLAVASNVVIGKVIECDPHPDSDHLHVTSVEIREGDFIQIVCGAPNIAKGQKVIVALPGCKLANGIKIKESVVRGIESNGMICSLIELGINEKYLSSAQKEGIEILDNNAPIGHEVLSYLGLNDTILDISLTPNRADCMSLYVLAIEVGAILNRKAKLPNLEDYNELENKLAISIQTDKCHFYSAKLIEDVVVKPSPQWLKTTLMSHGIKSVNNIVDIANFVMLETGQPVHMYDYNKLEDTHLIIKDGIDDKITLLDGENYKIDTEDIVVSTTQKNVCLAGILGSKDTLVDNTTKNIVIELASLNAVSIRRTSRRLNLTTDASTRFIKGSNDVLLHQYVMNRLTSLLIEFAEAKIVYRSISDGKMPQQNVVSLKENRVNELLGTNVTVEQIKDIFSRLDFVYEYHQGIFNVTVPSYRYDITMEADLVEEVARLYGYDNIPSTLPIMETTNGIRTNEQMQQYNLKNKLTSLGLHEVLTYTLVSPKYASMFNFFHDSTTVSLMSPLGEERSVTRRSIIPSLLQVVKYNQAHSNHDVSIFEFSKTYSINTEINVLGIACSGNYIVNKWQQYRTPFDFYVLKGFVEQILNQIGIDSSRYQLVNVESDNEYLHPGRSGYIIMNKEIIGVVGQVHPIIQNEFEIDETYIVELNMSVLLNTRTRKLKFEPIPQFPSVIRDIALVVDDTIHAYDIERTIKRASKKMVKEVLVFDVYQGEHVEKGKKSIAFNLVFMNENKTLSEEEVNVCLNQILETVKLEYNAILRG